MTRFVITVAIVNLIIFSIALVPRGACWREPEWMWRTNYRGNCVPLSGGFFYLLAVFLTISLGVFSGHIAQPMPWAVLVAGFVFVGALDDAAGRRGGGGFRGHVRKLIHGRLTTGCVKAVIGGATALLACFFYLRAEAPSLSGAHLAARVVLGGVLVALTANLVNLLDLRPGRAAKFAFLSFIPLAVWARELWTPALLGGVITIGWADAREQTMMGDLGSNLLGALIGLSLVASLSVPWQIAALLVAATGNALSEKYSFTLVIEGNRVLRAIDRIGRIP